MENGAITTLLILICTVAIGFEIRLYAQSNQKYFGLVFVISNLTYSNEMSYLLKVRARIKT